MGDVHELINLFGKISTNDHESLVTQFSQVLKTDLGVARFFLEASSWSVEKAVHAYLAETTNGRESLHRLTQLPVVTFISDLSRLQSTVFEPGSVIDMQWSFRNDGPEPWPMDTRIVFVDGERMNGFSSMDVSQAVPGEVVSVYQRLRAPTYSGTFAGTWRFACGAGYFGDPLWIIVTVGQAIPSQQISQPTFQSDEDMMEF